MVEPAAAVVLGPVGRAIAPPGEAAFRRGDERRPISIQSCACCSRFSASTSTGVWLTTLSSALWLQTSHSSGATLKSPTMMRRLAQPLGPARHALDEVELLAELRIDGAVGRVAAGGHIDVLQPDAARQPDADVPRLAIVLPVVACPGRRAARG